MHGGPTVMLTALDLEYEAVRSHLNHTRIHQHPAGTIFEVGDLGSTGDPVVLSLIGKGNHHAAVLAERAIAEFAPSALFLVGVAGALWPGINLGDVIVATHVYAYHGGTSEDDGLKARPRVWEMPHGPEQLAQQLKRTGEWVRYLPQLAFAGADPAGTENGPRVRFGPIAAGEVVRNSRISEEARWVRDHYHDAIAIEMEAAGTAQAAHLNLGLPVIVVRGISDLADGSKECAGDARWQPRAAANAAAFAVALAAALACRPQMTAQRPTSTGASGAPTMITHNNSSGNAQVGIQAGQINGNISVSLPPGLGGTR